MTNHEEKKINTYLASRHVRQRIYEFCGGTPDTIPTSLYLSRYGEVNKFLPTAFPVSSMDELLDEPNALFRSLWDKKSLVVDLDIEYVNFDFPAEAYLSPHRAFSLQYPVRKTIEDILTGYGIIPLHLLTGRGHHYLWSIRYDSALYKSLTGIGRIPSNFREYYKNHVYFDNQYVDDTLGLAFAGLGMVIEYLSHRILKTAASCTSIPVQLTAVATGPSERGREIVSIDISEYADPLNTRVLHVPFTPYLKPLVKPGIIHGGIRNAVPLMIPVPVNGLSTEEGIAIMRSCQKSMAFSETSCARIPDMTAPCSALIQDYYESDVARFHNYFYAVDHHSVEHWSGTYDNVDLTTLPDCTAAILRNPNDALLTPAGMQQVVRTLLSRNWHPRHIAGLIRSKFERDYGWGNEWYAYNASSRADVYTRIFAGLVETGNDRFIDFNCQSTHEKGICTNGHGCCGDPLKQTARERMTV